MGNEQAIKRASRRPGGFAILDIDPWLNPYRDRINARMAQYARTKSALIGIGQNARPLSDFANGYLYYGFHRTDGGGWVYREWAPAADAVCLVGDFNNWGAESCALEKKPAGIWEITLNGSKADALAHMSRVKARVTYRGKTSDHIPLYIRCVTQDPATHEFCGRIWDPPEPFAWSDGEWMRRGGAPGVGPGDPGGGSGEHGGLSQGAYDGSSGDAPGDAPGGSPGGSPGFTPLIYEAHVGMAQNKDGIGTYAEFAQNILPRVRDAGYNAVQLMAIAEHPYYASFGYQVSNFFAPSHWFGEPDDLKALIDAAHGMGLSVYMDLVHSHAVANVNEGINEFDGTSHQFFHRGGRGLHGAWGTKLFNYSKHEVVHFLLSNIKYWMSEFHFDGFRFDGVTSMIFADHGLGTQFDNYDKYFSANTDNDALVYLQLANELIHDVSPRAVTIAEDMSGMPGMCLPIAAGGMGFDYRLSMGAPDYWIRTLKTKSDEQISVGEMWHELTMRRPGERNVGYCESHDQSLVGDKTLMFWLADKEMYDGMSAFGENFKIDRAIALHKMIRFISLTLAGEGYLNFIGNEFGHPEWVDFPRKDNGWSYQHAKRRWDLADNDDLKYKYLLAFDREMLRFAKEYGVLLSGAPANLWMDERDQLLAFRKASLVFLFNFAPERPAVGFELPFEPGTPAGERYKVVFDSDGADFGGQGRIVRDIVYETRPLPGRADNCGVMIYAPARTFLALARV